MKRTGADAAASVGLPAWDADLDAAAVRRLSPADRRRRILASLTRKVELVETVARETRPGDGPADVPTNKASLRRLRDPARGLHAWTDPTIDREGGANADLVSRFHLAVEAIRARRRGGRPAIRAELELRDRRVAALEAQVLALLDERRELRERLARKVPGGSRGR